MESYTVSKESYNRVMAAASYMLKHPTEDYLTDKAFDMITSLQDVMTDRAYRYEDSVIIPMEPDEISEFGIIMGFFWGFGCGHADIGDYVEDEGIDYAGELPDVIEKLEEIEALVSEQKEQILQLLREMSGTETNGEKKKK